MYLGDELSRQTLVYHNCKVVQWKLVYLKELVFQTQKMYQILVVSHIW